MKTKYWVVALGVLLAAGALWAGWRAWRVHRQLVTLDVRNAPLAEVLHQVEQQTGKKTRAEKALDARITLHVTDKPLSYVLNRVAAQAGAHWSTVYAVYGSAGALKALDSALRGDRKLEPAGWTKIAPNPADFKPGGKGEPADHFGVNTNANDANGPEVSPIPEGLPPGADPVVENLPPIPPPEVTGLGEGQRRSVMAKRTKAGSVVFFGGPGGETEMWSPEELVLESALLPRLGGETRVAATAQATAEVARRVKGRWTTFLAFRKSSMGIGFGGMPPGSPGIGPGPHEPNERFMTLTPAQRVQRARERLQGKGR